MAISAARVGLIAALALKIANDPRNQAIMNPQGLPMNADCVHRDAVFANLNTAMTADGLTSADYLRQAAALDEAVANKWGSVNFEHGVYTYRPNDGHQQFTQEEQTLFSRLVDFFKQIKNCIGGTIQLVQGMNLWEQLNALLLASGLVGFATQCVNLGRAAGNCVINIGNLSYNTLKLLVNSRSKNNIGVVSSTIPNISSNLQRFKNSVKMVISLNKSNALFKNGLVRQTLRNMLSVIEKKHISKNEKNQALHKVIKVDEVSKEVWELLRTNPVKFITNDIRYRYKEEDDDFNFGGRPRTKRRPYKSKRRRTNRSSKKRRHYKTKKRVYRSTRFRTHR
jgi:hypothetical protein